MARCGTATRRPRTHRRNCNGDKATLRFPPATQFRNSGVRPLTCSLGIRRSAQGQLSRKKSLADSQRAGEECAGVAQASSELDSERRSNPAIAAVQLNNVRPTNQPVGKHTHERDWQPSVVLGWRSPYGTGLVARRHDHVLHSRWNSLGPGMFRHGPLRVLALRSRGHWSSRTDGTARHRDWWARNTREHHLVRMWWSVVGTGARSLGLVVRRDNHRHSVRNSTSQAGRSGDGANRKDDRLKERSGGCSPIHR